MKRFLSTVMAILTVAFVFMPTLTTNTKAITDSDVNSKISSLTSLFPQGSYFTASGSACTGDYLLYTNGVYVCYSTSCPNCKLSNVLSSNSKAKQTNVANCTNHKNTNSCCAFANFAFSYIFGHDSEQNVKKIRSSDYGGINNNFLSQLKKGDFLTMDNGSHYAIFLGYDSNYIYLYESNYSAPNKVEYNHKRSKTRWSSIVANRSLTYGSSTSSITYTTTNSKDTIGSTNAIVWAQIDKDTSASVSELGIVVWKKWDTSANGWSKYHAPSRNYVGSTVVQPYFNMNEELGLTLSPGIEYSYQFYAKIDGKDYWSNISSFKTTGTHTTHKKGAYAYFQASHPHYNCYYCTLCGEAYPVESETNVYSECDVCYSLGKSTVTTNKSEYVEGETVNIKWSTVNKATQYMLWIEKKNSSGKYTAISKNSGLKTNTFSTSDLKQGDYRIYHVTYNTNMWEKDKSDYRHTISDYVYFSVKNPTGWQSDANGLRWSCGDGTYAKGWLFIDIHWYYFNENGYMTTDWQYINGHWYYMNYGGVMLTGWQYIGGNWYYFNDGGVMQTGWVVIGGTWYYFNQSGCMLSNTWIDGYYLSASGAMTTPSWQQDAGGWWYSYGDGTYATGWAVINGSWYYFNASGYMVTGWLNLGGTWYYMNAGGAMLTDWQLIGGTWYYFYSDGSMVANVWIGNYYLTASGAMA